MKVTLTCLALVVPTLIYGQQVRDTARIAPVVVTATRTPLAADRVPASVSVITGSELRAQGITAITDALRQVPGLAVVQTGSYGGATSLFIRGGESKFAKVLIDGVPVNEAGGAFDFSSLSTDNLDRIEIVRGPASVLYGSDAMAGVVQLFTARGAAGVHGDIAARAGGYGSSDADGAVRVGSDAVSYSMGAARHATDGFQSFNSGYRQTVGSALVAAHAAQADGSLSLRYSDNQFHFPTDGSGRVVDSNAVHGDDRLALGIDAGYRFMPQAEARISLASYDTHGLTTDQPNSPGDTNGYYYSTPDKARRRSAELRFALGLPAASSLTLGTRFEREWRFESRTTDNFGGSLDSSHTRNTTGVYAQLLTSPAARLTTTLGARFEHNDQFGDFVTYRAAASTPLAEGTRLRASVGTAFREPTFLENYGSAFVIGNPSLNPERSLSFDGGIEQRVGGAALLALTLFQNNFRNLIDYAYSATAPNYNNIARTRTRGAETEARATILDGLRVDGEFTYLDARVIDRGASAAPTAAFAPGARLLRRPMHSIDAGLGYSVAPVTLEIRAHHVGTREDSYYSGSGVSRVTLAPYTRTDASAQVRLLDNHQGTVSATFRAENVLDVLYTDVAGYNYDFASRTDAAIAATGYRGAGRRVFAGLRLSF